jgi:hypothetical protein
MGRSRAGNMPWWAPVTGLWLALVLSLSLAGLIGVRVLSLSEGLPPIDVAHDELPGIWARWDSAYYFAIARHGYESQRHMAGFFPLYPLGISLLSRMTGWSLVLSGVLIAQACYLIAMLIVYRLALLVSEDRAFCMRTVAMMAVFPTSFFFLAMYAESMALMFGALSVYLALRGKWVSSGATLGLAVITRPVGWLLIVVLILEFVRRRDFTPRSIAHFLVGCCASVLGIIAYVLYLYSITGSFFAVTQAQSLWKRTWQWPWNALWLSISNTMDLGILHRDWFLYAINWFDLLLTLFAIAIAALSFRRIPLSLSVYLSLSIVFLLAQQNIYPVPLWAMGRWIAALLPIHLVVANLIRDRAVFTVGAAVSATAVLGLTLWWASGRWVG